MADCKCDFCQRTREYQKLVKEKDFAGLVGFAAECLNEIINLLEELNYEKHAAERRGLK